MLPWVLGFEHRVGVALGRNKCRDCASVPAMPGQTAEVPVNTGVFRFRRVAGEDCGVIAARRGGGSAPTDGTMRVGIGPTTWPDPAPGHQARLLQAYFT
ncbi:hypothetical protein CBM2633_A80017 [Cupriavidus taiwanensis]|nr:hypothetical protein CBM2633_A80017 [Cupriavidus taiwanensis]